MERRSGQDEEYGDNLSYMWDIETGCRAPHGSRASRFTSRRFGNLTCFSAAPFHRDLASGTGWDVYTTLQPSSLSSWSLLYREERSVLFCTSPNQRRERLSDRPHLFYLYKCGYCVLPDCLTNRTSYKRSSLHQSNRLKDLFPDENRIDENAILDPAVRLAVA